MNKPNRKAGSKNFQKRKRNCNIWKISLCRKRERKKIKTVKCIINKRNIQQGRKERKRKALKERKKDAENEWRKKEEEVFAKLGHQASKVN